MFERLMCTLVALLVSTATSSAQAEALYKKALPSIMTIRATLESGEQNTGTAFLTVGQGFAVTALHVVENAVKVTAHFANGETVEVTGLVDVDEKRDLALIRVQTVGRPLLSLASKPAEVGSHAYLIGAPQGLDFSISDGLISQFRQMDGVRLIQFSAPTNPGNSGGPLLNSAGEVVGVVSWRLRGSEGLNFAVEGTYVKDLNSSLEPKVWSSVGASRKSKPLPVGASPIVRTYKDGEQDTFALSMTALMSSLGSIDMSFVINQTVKKVHESGGADIETKVSDMRFTFGGQEMPTPNEDVKPTTQTYDKYGMPAGPPQGTASSTSAPMLQGILYAFYNAYVPKKTGDEIEVDEMDTDGTHTKGTVRLDKVEAGVAFVTVSLHMKSKQASVPTKMVMKREVWLDSGKLRKATGEITNLPDGQGMVVDSIKFTMERTTK